MKRSKGIEDGLAVINYDTNDMLLDAFSYYNEVPLGAYLSRAELVVVQLVIGNFCAYSVYCCLQQQRAYWAIADFFPKQPQHVNYDHLNGIHPWSGINTGKTEYAMQNSAGRFQSDVEHLNI